VVFSELIFLYVFLPIQLICTFFAKDIHAKNTVLLIASLVFYAWGEPVYLLLLIGLVFINRYLAIGIERSRQSNRHRAKALLILTCVVDLGTIGVFKYLGFLLGTTNSLFGVPSVIPHIALPIGISFYTFQILSYVIDVYRGEVPAQRSFRLLLLYVSLFHQCIAGPIVRYKDVCEELLCRKVSLRDISEGVTRFTVGLAKKAMLANHCGFLADQWLGKTTDSQVATAPALALWLGLLAYAMQIYLDFSAYSDMAIGMGRMMGLHYKENFDYPYISQSLTEFWRRWHMSLGSFFRDYVYIPLGGNRCSKSRHLFNMLVVWFLTGLWHGASWNYVLWGLYFFVFLALEKYGIIPVERMHRALRRVYAMAVVYFGWILFRFEQLGDVGQMLKGMIGLNHNGFTDFETNALFSGNVIFLMVAIIACTPMMRNLCAGWRRLSQASGAAMAVRGVWEVLIPIALLVLSTALLVGDSYNPFIYFQF